MTMTNLVISAALATATALGAPVGLKTLEPAFTGTIVSTYADGRTSRVWLNRDGTFTSEGRAHERKGGKWVIKRGDLCLSQLKPIPIPFLSYCTPIPSVAVDESWKAKSETGEPVVIRVLAQR